MPIALRDAPRGGQDGARLDKTGDEISDTQRNSKAAGLQAAHGHEYLPTVEDGKEHVEVAP